MVDNKFMQKGKVKLVKGSVLMPEYAGLRFVLNFVNMGGKPTGKIYTLFDKKWRKVKEEAKGWYASRINYKYGQTSTIAVQSDTWVINCLCQDENAVVDEKALNDCLKAVCKMAKDEKATVHVSNYLVEEFPKLQELLNTSLVDSGVSVSFYEETV